MFQIREIILTIVLLPGSLACAQSTSPTSQPAQIEISQASINETLNQANRIQQEIEALRRIGNSRIMTRAQAQELDSKVEILARLNTTLALAATRLLQKNKPLADSIDSDEGRMSTMSNAELETYKTNIEHMIHVCEEFLRVYRTNSTRPVARTYIQTVLPSYYDLKSKVENEINSRTKVKK